MTPAILPVFDAAKPPPSGVSIRPAVWARDERAIAAIRRAVFIDEQGVPEAMEWEAIDPECDWFVAEHDGGAVAVARLVPDGHFGRMAVLPAWRGLGIGAALLARALAAARDKGWPRVELHAQCHAEGFYRRFGFVPVGAPFDEAGIPHRHMILDFGRQSP